MTSDEPRKKGPIESGEFTYEDARRMAERAVNDPESLAALAEMDADIARRKKAAAEKQAAADALLRRPGTDSGRAS